MWIYIEICYQKNIKSLIFIKSKKKHVKNISVMFRNSKLFISQKDKNYLALMI